MHVSLILLLVFKWWILAEVSEFDKDARNLQWSLTNEYIIHADNNHRKYYLYFLSDNETYYMHYSYPELEVYSLYALTVRWENTSFAFVQIAKNMTSNHTILSRVTFNFTIVLNSTKDSDLHIKLSSEPEMSDLWNQIDDHQVYMFLKVDPQEKYAYVLAASFILSYDLSANKVHHYRSTNHSVYKGRIVEFIPYAFDVSNGLGVVLGFLETFQKAGVSSFHIIELPALTYRNVEILWWIGIRLSEVRVYNWRHTMSVSINPSGTLIAIGYSRAKKVKIHQVHRNKTIEFLYKGPLGMDTSATDFGRSVAWLDDQGTLAVHADKWPFQGRSSWTIHVYKNISTNSSSFDGQPDFILPNSQQSFEGVLRIEDDGFPLNILARSNGLLIFLNEFEGAYIPSVRAGYCASGYKDRYPFTIMQPKPCVSGTFKNTSGIGPCTICPPGTKNPGSNASTECQNCKSTSFCPLGASGEVNLDDFKPYSQTFNYPDTPLIDNYDDLLVLNFFSLGKKRCLLVSPLFWALLALALCVSVWIIMFFIKIRQLTSVDIHRKRAKLFFKYIDIIGEGERWVGGLASFVIFVIIVFSCWFAHDYLHSYPYGTKIIRETCKNNETNTKLESTVQLPVPELDGQYWEIFELLHQQEFSMTVYLINTKARCDWIKIQHQRDNSAYSEILYDDCSLSFSNNVTRSFSFKLPHHAATVQVGIRGGSFIGALLLCLKGLPNNRTVGNDIHTLHELDTCALFNTTNQTIGLKTDFIVHLIKVINVTKPLNVNGITRYDGRWVPIIKYTHDLSDEAYFKQYGQYLRYASTQTTFTVRLSEENYFVRNNQSPIIRRNALVFHTLIFFSLIIELFGIAFLLYKLCCQPLFRCLLPSRHDFLKHELQPGHTKTTIDFISQPPRSPELQPRLTSKSANAQSTENLQWNLANNSDQGVQLRHRTTKPSPLLTTSSTTGAFLSSDHLTVERLHEYFEQQLKVNDEKMERFSNDVVAMKNQNDELNRQITHLKQCLANVRQE